MGRIPQAASWTKPIRCAQWFIVIETLLATPDHHGILLRTLLGNGVYTSWFAEPMENYPS
jgi:hypothetical protein